MFKKIKNAFSNAKYKMQAAVISAKATAQNVKAEGYVDSGVKILIAVVIGALLLGLLYTLFNTTIMPTVSSKITGLFNYNGQ